MSQKLAWILLLALVTAMPITVPRAAYSQACRLPGCALSFPADAGIINVRAFGAKGDGKTDDTEALRTAIAASGRDTGDKWWYDRIIFLPAGTYLVSGSLVKRYANGSFASGMSLAGEGVDRTIIRLTDHAEQFQDPAAPRGVIMTTSKHLDAGGSRDYVNKGEGNDAFQNFVEALTVDVGTNNPGAVGIDYLASNLGAIRNVLIRGGNGSGATGISMLRQVPGPALIQNVTVEGFQTGIDIASTEYGMTLFNVELLNQRETGLQNAGNAVSAQHLTISGSGKSAVVNASPGGLIVLIDSTIDADPKRTIVNKGTIVFRNAKAPLEARPDAPAKPMDGVLTGQDYRPTLQSWSVPRPEIVTVDPGPSQRWVGVSGQPNEGPPVDSTAVLQRALDSGARTIYLRHGTFWISAALKIPSSVHRIVGMNSTLRVFPDRQPGFGHDDAMLQVHSAGEPLEIDRIAMDNSNRGAQLGIEQASTRPLLLRDIVSAGVDVLERKPSGGLTVLEDSCCGDMRLAGPAPVVARQFDTEGGGVRVQNDGAPLAIIGLKTEQESTIVRNTAGGRVEILGGLVYMVGKPSPDGPPAFINQNAKFTASFVEEVLVSGHGYRIYLQDKTAGQTREIGSDAMPARGYGRIVPLLSSGQ